MTRTEEGGSVLSKLNKPMVGVVMGALLGFLDGSTAWFYPDVRPMMVTILVGSTLKGLVAGLAAGFFARKFRSMPLGILAGLLFGFLVTYPVASQPTPEGKYYLLEILIPGMLVGALVGFATQRYGKAPEPARS
ncbi:MAG TPA: hypothetical protein VM120_17340 [Bryobacteraceae bacterium]|nr:hypothetical protein [Bryobacteraceae bacterium]